MKAFSLAFVLLFAVSAAPANTVTYWFLDNDGDEVFDVFIEIIPTTATGLATYNIQLEGLEAVGIDPSSISWVQNNLENFTAAFQIQGIQEANLLAGPVGTNAYSAVNGQFQSSAPVFGIGINPVFLEDNPIIPTDEPIDLGVPALLGQLTLPGANRLTDEEVLTLFTPNAAVFVGIDSGVVEEPTRVCVLHRYSRRCVPEPAAFLLAGMALMGAAVRRNGA